MSAATLPAATGAAKQKTSSQEKLGAVIDRLLVDMEQGKEPWRMPWVSAGNEPYLPVSGATGRPYRGFNVFHLWMSSLTNGWTSPRFYTFSQVRKLTGKVRKWQPGTEVFLWRPAIKLPAPVNGKSWLYEGQDVIPKPLPKGARRILILRTFFVWNADQCEDLPMPKDETPPGTTDAVVTVPVGDDPAEIAALIAALGGVVTVKSGGAVAAYSKLRDDIIMPERKDFTSSDGYYSTLFHEYSHASGHPSRLNRETLGNPDSVSHAVEELVAESGAALVMAALGQPYSSQHAAYLRSWAQALRGMPAAERHRKVLSAFQGGQKAADWVLSGGTKVPSPHHDDGGTESDGSASEAQVADDMPVTQE